MPDGWAWCRVGSITQFIRNGANIKQDKEAQGYPITRIETISNGEINTEKFGYANIFELEKFEKYLLHIDDILMSHINSPVHLGKSAIYDGIYETPIIHGMNLLCIRLVEKSSSYYLLYAFRTSLFKDFVWENMKQAVNQASITTASISSFLLPMAPFNEQRRITKTIKQYTNLIDRIENDKTNLQQILSVTKSKILDLAIRGKLVPQDPNDEPASVLLERIRAEKEELIKQGKIKRDKKESVIFKGEDNSYYLRTDKLIESLDDWRFDELPDNWSLCCLGEICDYGNCINVDSSSIAESAWILDLEDIEKDTGIVLKKIKKSERNAASTKHLFHKGQVLYSKLRPYLNKVVLADEDGYCTSEILPLDFSEIIVPEYARYFLMSPTFLRYANKCSYGVKMPRLGTTDGKKAILSLPPIEEQKRIVIAIEKAFSLLSSIIENLS